MVRHASAVDRAAGMPINAFFFGMGGAWLRSIVTFVHGRPIGCDPALGTAFPLMTRPPHRLDCKSACAGVKNGVTSDAAGRESFGSSEPAMLNTPLPVAHIHGLDLEECHRSGRGVPRGQVVRPKL